MDKEEKSPLVAKALLIAMKEYERLNDLKNTVGAIRNGLKCSSPAHTALSMYIDGQLDQLRCLVFSLSGFDYQLIEDMEEEVDGVVSNMKAVLEKNGWPVGEAL